MARKQIERVAETKVTRGTGNIFADIGAENPDEELTKARLTYEIHQIIKQRRLTQVAAAEVMGIDQPKVSALLNLRLANFSSERLMRLLTRLGQDVDIIVRAGTPGRRNGSIRVIRSADSSDSSKAPAAAAKTRARKQASAGR